VLVKLVKVSCCFILLSALLFTLLFVFMCTPVRQQWSIDRIGRCLDQILLLKAIILWNLITDLIIIILPIRSVLQLQFASQVEKIVVMACFVIGSGCVFISAVRFGLIFKIGL
jgi:hypothetical protein